MTRLTIGLGVSVLGLLVALLINTVRLSSLQPGVGPTAEPTVDGVGAVERLSRALSFQTVFPAVTVQDARVDPTAFHELHAFLRQAYPSTHERLDVARIANLSVLYTWHGTDTTLAPIVLMGHLDVVGVSDDSVGRWRHPPFGGHVANGFVWGRGAIDDKSSVLATLEAVELLLDEHFQPRRTIYLAFGHDEESGGSGARAILATIRSRGVTEFGLVLDEGGAILPGSLIPGIDQPVALIGVAEKRVLTLELSVRAVGGHASSPPPVTAIGRLGRAIARLEANPFPARLDGATAQMFRHLAPEMTPGHRVVFANLWLFRPFVLRILRDSADTAPLVRTTIAPTTIVAGSRVNVLPGSARATVNIRLLPGDTTDAVVRRVEQVVADGEVEIYPLGDRAMNDGVVSDASSPAFAILARSVRQTYRDAGVLVAPYLTIAAVDARWYAPYSPNVYRFRGMQWEADATDRMHGVNERISVDSFVNGIRFIYRLLKASDTLERYP